MTMNFFEVLLIGLGATLFMDVWAWTKLKLFKSPSLNYGLVGRWVLAWKHNQFTHQTILTSPEIKGENQLGWGLHYLIGVVFVFAHAAIWGEDWVTSPSLFASLLTGLITVLFPFLLLQPVFGFGFFANKTPNPSYARLQSIQAHCVFGLGIFVSASCFSGL